VSQTIHASRKISIPPQSSPQCSSTWHPRTPAIAQVSPVQDAKSNSPLRPCDSDLDTDLDSGSDSDSDLDVDVAALILAEDIATNSPEKVDAVLDSIEEVSVEDLPFGVRAHTSATAQRSSEAKVWARCRQIQVVKARKMREVHSGTRLSPEQKAQRRAREATRRKKRLEQLKRQEQQQQQQQQQQGETSHLQVDNKVQLHTATSSRRVRKKYRQVLTKEQQRELGFSPRVGKQKKHPWRWR